MRRADWKRVMATLESMMPYYEKVNLTISFFMLLRWRSEATRLAGPEDAVLEVGSGPGTFAALLKSREVLCLDPSEKMLRYSREVLEDGHRTLLMGVGENLPFKEGSFDKVFCIFSFRDFMDRAKGSRDIQRVLRKGGTFVIVDVLKPSTPFRKRIMDGWLRHGAWLVVRTLFPRAKDIL
ncbi:MAG: class I SAM-dependent methyltransferase, partial [Thermoplasmata archaeon]|nr:class I SAM-dependent methyltransferase [Thermoplasmata archaeon]